MGHDTGDDALRQRLAQTVAELAEIQLDLERERDGRIETQAVFDVTLNAMLDAVVLVDQRGRVARANAAAVRLLGETEAALIGRTPVELFGEAVPGTPWEVLSESRLGRAPTVETTVTTAAGTTQVSVSCSVAEDSSGKVVGAVYAARDLSETLRLLQEIRAAEARWRVMADLGSALSTIDPAGPLPQVCRLLAAATGATVAVVLTDGPVIAGATSSDDADPLVAALPGRTVDRGTALWAAAIERRVVHAQHLSTRFPLVLGEMRDATPVRSAAVVPITADGELFGVMLVHASEAGAVTDAVLSLIEQSATRVGLGLANAQMSAALAHLEAEREAAEYREEILASLSHDMQTPLATLQASVELLRMTSQRPEEQEKVRERMDRNLRQLRRLIRQFLDFARLEAGQSLLVRLEPTDVGAAIAASCALMTQRRIETDVPPDLPSAVADRDRLDQVLANLLSNAIKFSPSEAPVTVRARATDTSVEVVVADRGPGIRPRDLARIFEKFHRGSATGDTYGTGLGLYMSRAQMEAQGGTISVSSRPGGGSQFTVTLPRPPARP
jgi:PAS domain S-box-containing protein